MKIAGQDIQKGERKTIELHLGRLYDFTELMLPIRVIHGYESGPVLFLSGALHGDELTGTAVIKKIINSKRLRHLKGTLIAIPIVNVFGFNSQSRYLPDRRDLNRCFPGNSQGSLGSRIAALFMEEIVSKADFGIDFHSGAKHRSNLPQIRTLIDDPVNRELAEAFGVPVILDSRLRDGSLREAAAEIGVKMLVYEGGEALRLDQKVIRSGVRGAFSVMERIGMLQPSADFGKTQSYVARSSYWIRASQAGMIQFDKNLGSPVNSGDILGHISDAFGLNREIIRAPTEGIVVGISRIPLANKGDALYHIATFEDATQFRALSEELYDFVEE